MDTSVITKALAIIQQNTASIGISADLVTLGAATANIVVQMFKSGKQLVAYLITRKPTGKTDKEQPSKPLRREHVAVLVDINRRILQDVPAYLEQQGIEADFVVVTNDETYGPTPKFIDPQDPALWTGMVREFGAAMNKIKHEIGGAHMHFFISAPMPIAFGIGAVWGTVDEATVYHWENQTYYPVLHVTRELRS
jgi:hypothetical protein